MKSCPSGQWIFGRAYHNVSGKYVRIAESFQFAFVFAAHGKNVGIGVFHGSVKTDVLVASFVNRKFKLYVFDSFDLFLTAVACRFNLPHTHIIAN